MGDTAVRLRRTSKPGDPGAYDVVQGGETVGHVATDFTRHWCAFLAGGGILGAFDRRHQAVDAIVAASQRVRR